MRLPDFQYIEPASLEDAVSFLRVGTDQLGVSKGAELIAAFAAKYPDGIEI